MRTLSQYFRHLPLLFLGLAVLLVSGYALFIRLTLPDPGIVFQPESGEIITLDSQGVLHRAGAQAGDRILAVNGDARQPIQHIYGRARAGDTVRWEVQRGGLRLTLSATLQRPPWRERLLKVFPLLVALVYWGISFSLWLFTPSHKTIRRFFLLGQLVALILTGGSLSTYAIYWGFPLYQAAFIAIIPISLHFFAAFPQQDVSTRVQRLIRGAYFLAALLGTQIPLRFFGLSLRGVDAVLRVLTSLFFIAGMLLAVALFAWRWFRASPPVRQRQRLIVIGIVASILPLVLFYSLPVMLRGRPIIGYTPSFGFLILFPIAVSYAVRSGELGAIDWFLNRTLVRILLIGLLAAGYAGLFTLFNTFFTQGEAVSPLFATLLAVLLTLLFNPLQRFLQHWADRFFYKGWYDYRSVVGRTGEDLAEADRPEELAHTLLNNMTTAMKLRCACFLFPAHAQSRLFMHAPQGCPLFAFADPVFSTDTSFHETLSSLKAPIPTAALRRKVPISLRSAAESALLGCPHAQLWIPAGAPATEEGSDAPAVLIVGSRHGYEAFSPEDMDIFQSLARQTALVIRNIRLLNRLQQREKEIVYLYKDLTYAREEERKRIARELHDNIIQNIHVIYRSIKDRRVLPPEQAEANLDESAQWLQNTMNDIRRICNDLRPAALDVLGLADAIRSHAERFQRRTGTEVFVIINGEEDTLLPETTEIMLFRIFQEALWNVEKHAQARRVTVRLRFPPEDETGAESDVLVLSVQDDGRGFEIPTRFDALIQRNAFGLLNMHERAAMVGGTFHIQAKPGSGVYIEVRVPNPAAV